MIAAGRVTRRSPAVRTVLLVLTMTSAYGAAQDRRTCPDLAACRQAAVEAAARRDYEAFHDFAWLAAQKGPRNDPGLMQLIARAQSLSGRPGDALVMIRRLAEMGIPTDARDSDDFKDVRSLAGWADVEPLVAAANERGRAEPAPPPPPVNERGRPEAAPLPPAPAPPAKADWPGKAASPSPSIAPPPPAPVGPGRGNRAERTSRPAPAAPAARPGETLLLGASSLEPIGLAYDATSRRFVVGDGHADKLVVADEVFKQVNDLIGAASAGFSNLTALDIDARRGDLWVASAGAAGAVSVHKLQLVSGRVLARFDVPDALRPVSVSDLVVTDTGAVLLADTAGRRLLRIEGPAGEFTQPLDLGALVPLSIAASSNRAYVAHDGGLSLLDLATGRRVEVRAPASGSLEGLRRIRWHRGSLVAIQADAQTAAARLVRIRLGRASTAATAIETLVESLDDAGSSLTIAGDAACYVAPGDNGPVIRRIELR